MKILWMTPKWTLPVTDGARVATDSLIRNTISAGAQVDVLCLPDLGETVDPRAMKELWKIRSVEVIRRNISQNSWKKKIFFLSQLLSSPSVPLTFASFATKDIRQQVMRSICSSHYDYILLDGLHLGASLIEHAKLPKVIYRAHNIESDLWIKAYKEKKNPVLKLLLYFQSKLVQKYEKAIMHRSSAIAAISQEDLAEISKDHRAKATLVPLGLNFSEPLPACTKEHIRFLFIGRLDWPPNRDGLDWLLKEVWPQVVSQRPDAVLKIVGSGNRTWLEKYSSLKGVEIVGFVKDIKDAYQDCHFTIVPITYGSGTRIKVLESFAMGRRLISTKMGVQGADLDSEDYVRTESREEWIHTLSKINLDQEELQKLESSRQKVALKFCEKKIGNEFYSWLSTL